VPDVHLDREEAMEFSAVQDAAAALAHAYDSGKAIPPIVESHPRATVTDAYRIQQAQVETWARSGEVVRGYKVGLASRALQRQVGVDEPDFGRLTGGMFHLEHMLIPPKRFIQPRVQPGIAFLLERPLQGPGVTVGDAVRAVDCVLPALEIADSRIQDWNVSAVDTIADNASCGGVVLGSTPTLLNKVDLDLRLVGCILFSNGAIAATGAGGAVLGSPLTALIWLANALGALGVTLEPGQVILSGSLTRAIPIAPGDTIVTTLAALGSVTAVLGARFEG
jgi:2-keto-4-pentenoate hydratase